MQQENEKLKKENGLLEQNVNSTYETSQEMLAELSKENKQLKDTIDKVREEVEIQLEMFKGTDNTVMIAVFEKLSSILGDKDE